jgi:hypothetical protein
MENGALMLNLILLFGKLKHLHTILVVILASGVLKVNLLRFTKKS